MNTNPAATTIMCYGDSNTWGRRPDSTARFGINERWTGILQMRLGENYYVIEEGLRSRTTNVEDDEKPGRNGKTYLQPCLESHNPVDLVIIMLGTNDLKIKFNRSSTEIALALGELVKLVREFGQNVQGELPEVLLVSPVAINEKAEGYMANYAGEYDMQSAQKSLELASEINTIAEKLTCKFLDAAPVAKVGIDGVHIDSTNQVLLAEAIYQRIINLKTS